MTEKFIGKHVDELDTPFLGVDLDAMDANIADVSQWCQSHDVEWRPHCKCHKSGEIGKKLIAGGASGITCAKVSEAEVMADAGIENLLIANMIVGPGKVRRLVALRQKADPIITVDCIEQAQPVSEAMEQAGQKIRAIIEVDIGLHRVGVAPGEATVALARQLNELDGIEFSGIMGYEGHLLTIADLDEKKARISEALALLVSTSEQLKAAGLACPIVSCGGTGSYQVSVAIPGITEVQAGGAIIMDEFYRRQCKVENLKNALHVFATVVSRPAPDRAIIDAGRKSFAQDSCPSRVVGREEIEVSALSAEHGHLVLPSEHQDLAVGDRLRIIPGYNDMTTVLHNQFVGFRKNQVEVVWKLEARGGLT